MPAFNTVFTVFSGIGFILSLIPLCWHVKSWDMHVGTCMYMVWTALGCLVHFVDSIVWNGNAINWAPVWCDIGMLRCPFTQNNISQLQTLFSLPHPSRSRSRMACLRSLHHPSPLQHHCRDHSGSGRFLCHISLHEESQTVPTSRQRRRQMITDLLITVGIPVLQMVAGEHFPLSLSSANSTPFVS